MMAVLRQRGYSLIELITTVSILSVIVTATANSWGPVTERLDATAMKANLKDAFGTARANAVYKRQIITLCPLNEDNNCVARWNTPVSIFLDPANSQSLAQDDYLIHVIDFDSSGALTASSAGSSERRYFQYSPDGSARGTVGHLTWCPRSKNASAAIQLVLNFGGRVRWARDLDADGTAEDSSGQPLECS